MNRRHALLLVAVVALVASAGCLGYVRGGGTIENATLDQDPKTDYVWDSDRDVYVDVGSEATYRAVYNVSDRDELELYAESGYGTKEPLDLRAFRYQYANGTVINGSEFRARGGEIEQTTDQLWVRFGDDMDEGKLAFSGDGSPRRFILQTYVDGSYEVVLPEGYTTDFWLFGHVSPRGYEVTTEDGRQHIVWEEVTAEAVLVQAYRQRDFWIFVGIAIVATGIAVGGLLYFRRQLKELRARRQSLGLDVEEEYDEYEDDRDGPPPGRP